MIGLILWALADELPSSKFEVWAAVMAMAMPTAILGWLMIRRNYVEIDTAGVLVVNPVNEARFPWGAINDVDESPSGLLRFVCADWSIGCWAIQSTGLDRFLGRTSCVELMQDLVHAHVAEGMNFGEGRRESYKRWQVPLIPFGVVAVLALLLGALVAL